MLKAIAAAGAAIAAMPMSLMLAVAASPGASGTVPDAGLSAASPPSTLARSDIPAQYLIWYMDAAQTCPGLPWSVLAGIGKVETDHGRSNLPGVHSGANSAGAEGPMQFLPATFAEYAVNADPGQPLTPYDPADAIYTAAKMLCANGAPGNIQRAVYAYNHAGWYVTEVLAWASRYATPVGAAGKIIAYALAQIGKPYQWGATGPGAFDCSGLTMMAYRYAGITIPRTSQEQWTFGERIPASQVQPGDLVFYVGADGTAAAPGHVGIVYTATTTIVASDVGQPVQIQPIDQPGLIGYTDPAARP